MEKIFSIYRGRDGLALKLREEITCLNEQERIWCWSPFEFWKEIEDDAAPASYFGSSFLLKIPIDSRLVFFERNSIIYNFFRNKEDQISTFSRPKMRFKLLLKIVICFEHFWKFSQYIYVSLSNLFFKKTFFWS